MKRMNFEKRVRVSPRATPEEALKTVAITDEQRDTLIPGLQKIRDEVRGYDRLARLSPNLKERMRDLNLARTALANLTKALIVRAQARRRMRRGPSDDLEARIGSNTKGHSE
jgi:hypothetical protein